MSIRELRYLGQIEGRKLFYGDPGLVDPPGFYYQNDPLDPQVHLPLPPKPVPTIHYDAFKAYSDDELIYSACARCKCGAGMAYIKGIGAFGFWGCSAQLKHEVPDKQVIFAPGLFSKDITGHPHDAGLMFTVWEIKSELQPSAHNASTRPPKQVHFKINGADYQCASVLVTQVDLVRMAFGPAIKHPEQYTVTHHLKRGAGGILHGDKKIRLEDGLVINCTLTGDA